MAFDKVTIAKHHDSLMEVVKNWAKERGLEYDGSSCSYTETSSSFRFKINTTSEDGLSSKEKEWERYAKLFGLKKEWLGKVIDLNGVPFKIVGLNMNGRKNKVAINRLEDNAHFKTSVECVKRKLGENGKLELQKKER